MTNIADLKSKLSDYVTRAERGEEILISRHNRPVTRLVPLANQATPKRGSMRGAYRGMGRVLDSSWDGVASPLTNADLQKLGTGL